MISELKTELLLSDYADLSDQEVADALNAETIEQSQEYMLTDVRLAALVGTVKAVTVIEAFKAQGDPVSLWIVEKLASTGLDIGNAEAPAFVLPLVDSGVVTQAEAELILDKGKRFISRAQQIGINSTVMDYHVAEARNG